MAGGFNTTKWIWGQLLSLALNCVCFRPDEGFTCPKAVLSPSSNQKYSLPAKVDKHNMVAKPWNFNPCVHPVLLRRMRWLITQRTFVPTCLQLLLSTASVCNGRGTGVTNRESFKPERIGKAGRGKLSWFQEAYVWLCQWCPLPGPVSVTIPSHLGLHVDIPYSVAHVLSREKEDFSSPRAFPKPKHFLLIDMAVVLPQKQAYTTFRAWQCLYCLCVITMLFLLRENKDKS